MKDNFNFGYACLNVELREKGIFMSRTCRLKTLQEKGLDYVKGLAIQNLKDGMEILKWNVENGIYFMRLSSEIFPFASHLEHGYSISFAKSYLEELGNFAREHGVRLTMHPGQYCVLSSPDPRIIENTKRDLKHHADILEYLGLGKDSVMIIHGGGVYGNKQKALERLENNIISLPQHVRDRLVLENCEMAYTVEDLLPISEKLQIPIVIDFHHDDINPSEYLVHVYFDRVFKVWNNRGIKPKVHVSNSCPGITIDDTKTARRKHGDYIYFLHEILLSIDFNLDIMVEAKMKEKAVKKIRLL